MIDHAQVVLFLPIALAITLIPGQDVLFVLAQSVRGGVRAGLCGMAGILAAFFLVHVMGAALGLSALILRSATAFAVVKYAGAAYLLYLGIRALLGKDDDVAVQTRPAARRSSPFAQGFITNVLNPKVAIFMLAFLPQFIVPAHGMPALQVIALGAIWAACGVVVLGGVAVGGAALGALRARSRAVRRAERYLTGTIFVGLGLRVALPDHR